LNGGKLIFYDYNSGLNVKSSVAGLLTNTWQHIAVVRSGTSWYFFVDGIQLGTTQTSDKAVSNYSNDFFYVGGYNLYDTDLFTGWMDELRISKGIARWTSNFDPRAYEYGTTPTETPTHTATYTATNTSTETMTATASETSTETITPTMTETPTVTFTPTETVSPTVTSTPTITETPTITLTPTTPPPINWAEGPVTLSEALLAALASTLQADPPADAESNVYAVTNISGVDTAWNVSVVNLVDVAPPYDVWNQEDNAAWAWFMECAGTEPTWSCDYYELPAGGGTGSLRFPWKTGYSAYYGVSGVHAGAVMISGSSAVDFVGGDSMGSNIMPPQVVAVADGTITNICSDGVSMAIRVDGGPTTVAYFHFDTGQSFSEGQTITQGQVLGQLKYGLFTGLSCGYATQNADQYHLHFVFVPTSPGYLEIGGCVLDLDTEAFVCNGKTYSPTALIPNGGGTSIPGTPVPGAPPDYPTGGGAHIWDGIVAAIVSLSTDTLSQFLPDQNPIIGYAIQKVNLVIQALLAVFMAIYSYGMSGTVLTLLISAVIALEIAMKVVELAIYLVKEYGWLLKFFV
jgi:hypothetical protein